MKNLVRVLLVSLLFTVGCAKPGAVPTPTTTQTVVQKTVYFNKVLADSALTLTTIVPILSNSKVITVPQANEMMRFATKVADTSITIANTTKGPIDPANLSVQITSLLQEIAPSSSITQVASTLTGDNGTLVKNAIDTIKSTILAFTGALKQ